MSDDPFDIYRKEALDHLARPEHEGHLLQLSRWIRWSYWLLLAVSVVGLLYVGFGQVREYATGQAIVKADDRKDLTAPAPASVESVEIRPGQRVAAGQVLVRFRAVEEAAEVRRIQQEFDAQLVKRLRDLSDTAAAGAITTLRAQLDQARARLAERTVVAPQPGIVSDVRIRVGQRLQAGDIVVSLVGEQAGFRVVAILAGHYRPLIARGKPLRLEVSGYPYAYQMLTIDSVDDQIIGPDAVKRYLGPDIADTVAGQGALLLVEAHLPSHVFVADGRQLEYYDGMPGKAEVAVRSESILVTLVPALKALWSHERSGDGPL